MRVWPLSPHPEEGLGAAPSIRCLSASAHHPPPSCPVPGAGNWGDPGGSVASLEWGEPLPAPQPKGWASPALQLLPPGSGVVAPHGPRGRSLCSSTPFPVRSRPSLRNKYLYCAVQNTSASPPRREGSLPAPPVTSGTPCRATAPAGSPARSPVSGCSAVH